MGHCKLLPVSVNDTLQSVLELHNPTVATRPTQSGVSSYIPVASHCAIVHVVACTVCELGTVFPTGKLIDFLLVMAI